MMLMGSKRIAAEAVTVEEVDRVLVIALSEGVRFTDVAAVIAGNEDALSDVQAVLLTFDAGGFTRVARGYYRAGARARLGVIRRRIPVAWLVAERERPVALRLALSFASLGVIRGTFVERGPAWAWLQAECYAGRRANA